MPSSPPHDAAITDLAAFVTRDLDHPATVEDHQAIIESAARLIELGDARLHELVLTARRDDVSWQAVGESLGVSRQAAFKRFGGASADGSAYGSTSDPHIDLLDRTRVVFQHLQSGDYESVRSLMTYTCARTLTKRRLMSVWAEVVAASGTLQECADLTAQIPDGRTAIEKFANRHLSSATVVQTILHHESGEWLARVAYNGAGKITGIFIAPPDSRDLPF